MSYLTGNVSETKSTLTDLTARMSSELERLKRNQSEVISASRGLIVSTDSRFADTEAEIQALQQDQTELSDSLLQIR